MLQDALEQLLSEKSFDKISIQEIADRSTLNRATFYDHYPDKFALLEATLGKRFRDLIQERGICFNGCKGAAKAVAMALCHYLTETPGGIVSNKRQSSQLLDTSIVPVVRGMILEGLLHHQPKPEIPAELLAATVAWAIYGAAREWAHTPNRVPVEQIAETIEKMTTPMFASLAS